MSSLNEKMQYLAQSKQMIKEAIIDKGVAIDETDPFRSYAEKISLIDPINSQRKLIKPSVYEQDILPDEGYNALSKVTVQAVTADIDENISSENIKQGVSILGVSGSLVEGEPIGSYENGYTQGKTDGYNDGHEAGYTEGHKDGYDECQTIADMWYNLNWDYIQSKGTKTDYTSTFSSETGIEWNNENFKPKYDMRPITANFMFSGVSISGDFVEILENCGVVLDFSNCTKAWQVFNGIKGITRLGTINFSKVGGNFSFFWGMTNLETIDLYIPPQIISSRSSSSFTETPSLKNITFGGMILSTYSFASSPLTAESAKSTITHLENYAGTENEFTYTITFSPTTWEYLDAEGDTASPNGNSWREYIQDLGWNV